MSVKIKVPKIETIEYSKPKLDMSLFRKRSSGKTSSGIIIGYMKKFRNQKDFILTNHELLFLFESVYKDIKNLEISTQVQLDSWKGKSGIQVFKYFDNFIVVTHQKFDQDSEQKEVTREIKRDEINRVIWAINKLNNGEKIKTRDIGELVYKKNWDKIFADRYTHTQFNLILRLLDFYGIIHYRGGLTKVLKNVVDIQTCLNDKLFK